MSEVKKKYKWDATSEQRRITASSLWSKGKFPPNSKHKSLVIFSIFFLGVIVGQSLITFPKWLSLGIAPLIVFAISVYFGQQDEHEYEERLAEEFDQLFNSSQTYED